MLFLMLKYQLHSVLFGYKRWLAAHHMCRRSTVSKDCGRHQFSKVVSGFIVLLLLKGSDQTKPLLTNREREVFELLVQDKTTKEIAGQLFISEKTVRNHISNVMQKLGVKGRSQAVVELVRLGELEI
ncbi:hypothetical protein BCE02nite_59790 [Brevibacillus centrosporus]|nr:hypothetical protein BCE02nite_59790 [Brevibacillus centrosporus]